MLAMARHGAKQGSILIGSWPSLSLCPGNPNLAGASPSRSGPVPGKGCNGAEKRAIGDAGTRRLGLIPARYKHPSAAGGGGLRVAIPCNGKYYHGGSG